MCWTIGRVHLIALFVRNNGESLPRLSELYRSNGPTQANWGQEGDQNATTTRIHDPRRAGT